LVPLLIGAVVSVGLGAYGRFHHPAGYAFNLAGFSSALAVKTWLATVALLFAIVQVISGRIVYRGGSARTATIHRWSGRTAFLVTVPVAVQCLYALGFQTYSTRVLIHSLLGCLFFGVFTIKMLVLTRRGPSGWLLPLLGGLLFAVLVGIWLSSALWFFDTFGVTF
jgi:hypothetical protein